MSPSRKKTLIVLAVTAVGSCMGLTALGAGYYWFSYRGQPVPVTDEDRRSLLTLPQMGLEKCPRPEVIDKEKRNSGVVVLHWECKGIGKSGAGAISQWRFDHPGLTDAMFAQQAAVAGGRTGFQTSAKNGERMVELQLPSAAGDELFHARYEQFDGTPYGHYVVMRQGRHLYMLSTNGWVWQRLDALGELLDGVAAQLEAD